MSLYITYTTVPTSPSERRLINCVFACAGHLREAGPAREGGRGLWHYLPLQGTVCAVLHLPLIFFLHILLSSNLALSLFPWHLNLVFQFLVLFHGPAVLIITLPSNPLAIFRSIFKKTLRGGKSNIFDFSNNKFCMVKIFWFCFFCLVSLP